MTIIGSKALDEKIFLGTLEVETMTEEEMAAELAEIEEEVGEVSLPKLEADKYTPLDFYIDGKLHPRFDEIWDYVKKGADETPEEIMKRF